MAYDIRLARVLAHHAKAATMSNDVQAEAKRGLRMMLTDSLDSRDPVSNEVLRLNLTFMHHLGGLSDAPVEAELLRLTRLFMMGAIAREEMDRATVLNPDITVGGDIRCACLLADAAKAPMLDSDEVIARVALRTMAEDEEVDAQFSRDVVGLTSAFLRQLSVVRPVVAAEESLRMARLFALGAMTREAMNIDDPLDPTAR
ncbi:MAG: hypothetical protein DMF98_10930 [Acidobacteria bacterium]|nr:MAG: hypothetical protein DMF98_10930 [Acidobacteriota bacterium]